MALTGSLPGELLAVGSDGPTAVATMLAKSVPSIEARAVGGAPAAMTSLAPGPDAWSKVSPASFRLPVANAVDARLDESPSCGSVNVRAAESACATARRPTAESVNTSADPEVKAPVMTAIATPEIAMAPSIDATIERSGRANESDVNFMR